MYEVEMLVVYCLVKCFANFILLFYVWSRGDRGLEKTMLVELTQVML